MDRDHRKRVRHYDEPFHVHELTFSCYRRRPLLNEDWIRVEVCRAIDAAVRGGRWRLIAFVLMPEHVHLIVQPAVPALSTSKGPEGVLCGAAGLPSSAEQFGKSIQRFPGLLMRAVTS